MTEEEIKQGLFELIDNATIKAKDAPVILELKNWVRGASLQVANKSPVSEIEDAKTDRTA